MLRGNTTRFLRELAASAFAGQGVSSLDATAFALAIGREERAIAEIGARAGLTAGRAEAAVRQLEEAGYAERLGLLVRLTPAGARWYAGQVRRRGGR
jgi:DNA-binding MarR family transcriptional regulator